MPLLRTTNPKPSHMSPQDGGFDYMGNVKPSDIGLKNAPKSKASTPKKAVRTKTNRYAKK